MVKKLKVAIIQMASNTNKQKNIAQALKLCRQALVNKAKFIILPETFNYCGEDVLVQAENLFGSTLAPFQWLAARYRVWILAGSIYEKIPGKKKVYNTSCLIADDGKVKTVYRKIHLFSLDSAKRIINEAEFCLAGNKLAIGLLNGVKIGLSICYDLRFPELYRNYAKSGVKIICVPSAFTQFTGKAHWQVLLRARAIENQCFVLAANQAGINAGVKTYGHSMIVDPWGNILGQTGSKAWDIVYAVLDFKQLKKVRYDLPALKHRRLGL